MSKKEIDDVSGTQTTGHEWDGIKELDTPMPRWWLGLFWATIIWSVGYWIVYPAWPGISTYTRGVLNHSQRDEVTADVAALKAARAGREKALARASLPDIQQNPDLLQFAMAAGKTAFGDNCAACHGAGGQVGGQRGQLRQIDQGGQVAMFVSESQLPGYHVLEAFARWTTPSGSAISPLVGRPSAPRSKPSCAQAS